MNHKTIKYTFIITLLIIAQSGWSQNTNLDYKYAFKVYNLTTYERQISSQWVIDTPSSYYQHTASTLQILHPTIAFQWKNSKNNFHEIELTNLVLSKNGSKNEFINDSANQRQTLNENTLSSTTNISVRYEYISNLNKSKDSKFVPSVGFGANVYFNQNKYTPKISNSFLISEKLMGLRTFITPRLICYLNSKLFIDVNIPICFFDSYLNINKENNPGIPPQQRKSVTINFELFPKIVSGRIGIGVKI